MKLSIVSFFKYKNFEDDNKVVRKKFSYEICPLQIAIRGEKLGDATDTNIWQKDYLTKIIDVRNMFYSDSYFFKAGAYRQPPIKFDIIDIAEEPLFEIPAEINQCKPKAKVYS